MTTPPEYQHPEDPDEATAALLAAPEGAESMSAGRWITVRMAGPDSLPPYVTAHVCPVCDKIADPFKAGHEPGCGYGKIASKEHSREEH